jgi:hypothetical protein
MQRAVLWRGPSTDQGTVGALRFGPHRCYSLELPWRDNVPRISAIPPGDYSVLWVRSPSKGWCYALANVPGRSGILIHSANLAGDVERGWQTQLLGCIAPALRLGAMKNRRGVMQLAGLVSKPAVDMLARWGERKPFVLEIRE